MNGEATAPLETRESVLSHYQAKELLAGRNASEVASSDDLGLTKARFRVAEDAVLLSAGERVTFEQLEEIAANDSVCYRVRDAHLHPIRAYSEEFERTFQLFPTASSPAMLISGFVMHRIKDVSPAEGARKMVEALGRVRGRMLDTATGLGYAAIAAAKTADEVVTVELDPTARLMAKENPWSRELFTRKNIELLLGPSERVVETFADGSFSTALHDPPAISIAGDLYGLEFYRQLKRVLTKSGRLFHYIGDPKSQFGSRTTSGTIRRLYEAGFKKVVPRPEAFGVLAFK